MIRKITAASLLVAALLASALPLISQTRPRRVTSISSTTDEEIAPRRRREETAPRRRGWTRVLLEGGIAIGSQIGRRGRDSCTPSRDIIRDQPRQRF